MNRAARAIAVVLLLALTGTQGCHVVRKTPVVPVPIRLASPRVFLVRQLPVEGSVTTGVCDVLQASGDLDGLHGDTLVFRRISGFRQPRGDAPCRFEGAAYVVISQHPDLRAQTKHFSGRRTVLATPVAFLATALLLAAIIP